MKDSNIEDLINDAKRERSEGNELSLLDYFVS